MNETVAKGFRIAILIFFSMILFWLAAVAGTSTAWITPFLAEKTFLISDSIWLNLLCAAFFFALLVLYEIYRARKVSPNNISWNPQKRRYVFLLAISIPLVLLILLTQKKPAADQALVLNCVDQWRKGDFSSLTKGGEYLDRYPNQRGLVLILYLLSFLFGAQNYLAFQFVNMACLLWFYAMMLRLCNHLCDEKDHGKTESLLMLLFFLFIPLGLYTNFVYGTLIGLALSTAALEKLQKLLDSFRWRDTASACLMLFFAIIFKQNYLIFALGFLISLIISMIEKAQWKLSIPCAGILAVILLNSTIVNAAVTTVTGQHLRDHCGISPLSYIAMGLQENDKMYDGWWNNYNISSYNQNEFDQKAQAEEAGIMMRERLGEMAENPRYAIRFLAGKNASQWNNPGFEGFWINQILLTANNEFTPPNWITTFFGLRGSNLMKTFLNRLQFIILFGAVLSILFQRQDHFLSVSLFLVFLGGFVFHTFWEAKGQYTLTYFILLLPLSARGWAGLVHWMTDKKLDRRRLLRTGRNRRSAIILSLFLCVTIIAQTGVIPFLNDTIRRDEGTEAYHAYLQEITAQEADSP